MSTRAQTKSGTQKRAAFRFGHIVHSRTETIGAEHRLGGASRKKRTSQRLALFFQRNSFLTERVKYASACEIAYGSEIRLRRVRERISFHIATLGSNILQFLQENYFTFGESRMFRFTNRPFYAIMKPTTTKGG